MCLHLLSIYSGWKKCIWLTGGYSINSLVFSYIFILHFHLQYHLIKKILNAKGSTLHYEKYTLCQWKLIKILQMCDMLTQLQWNVLDSEHLLKQCTLSLFVIFNLSLDKQFLWFLQVLTNCWHYTVNWSESRHCVHFPSFITTSYWGQITALLFSFWVYELIRKLLHCQCVHKQNNPHLNLCKLCADCRHLIVANPGSPIAPHYLSDSTWIKFDILCQTTPLMSVVVDRWGAPQQKVLSQIYSSKFLSVSLSSHPMQSKGLWEFNQCTD